MSYDSSSSPSVDEIDALLSSEYSTLGTYPSDLSSFSNGGGIYAAGDERSLLQSVGYGVSGLDPNSTFSNAGFPFDEVGESSTGNAEDEGRAIIDLPWSPLLHQWDPFHAARRAAAESEFI